jgi:DNA-binding response OmpR family regulator
MTHPLIAVIEDEDHLAQGLLFNLEAEGYRTHHESDGNAALTWLLEATAPDTPPENRPSAILLDVMLPGRDGFSIVRSLRAAGRYTPVLLLTARGRSEDIVEGFEAGADDYLPKPFDLAVLFARLTALLRRMSWPSPQTPGGPSMPGTSGMGGEPQPPTTPQTTHPITLNNRIIDFDTLEIRTPPTPNQTATTIHLTLMEADLLRYLLDRPNKIVSRKDLLGDVWHVHEDTDTRAIDNFIVRLRRYLEPDPAKPIHLLTVRGIGYRFIPGE